VTDKKTLEQARHIFTAGKLLRRHIFSTVIRAEAEKQKQDGPWPELSMAQFNLLTAIRAAGEITGSELAAQLGVSPPSVSVMVDRLVERGLLVRRRSARDRRKVALSLSEQAASHFGHIEEKVLASFVSLVEALGPETAAQWVEVLHEVEQVLRQQAADDEERQ